MSSVALHLEEETLKYVMVAHSSSYLKTHSTYCRGLPPGPGGALGAVEGVSYSIILGVIGWSTYSKLKTGSGIISGSLRPSWRCGRPLVS
jgi:hypothetical protein